MSHWQGKESKAHEEAWARLKGADGILVPGGFGTRGVEGKVLAAHYARTANKPYLGICLGMQIAVIEFARTVLGLVDANSAEFDAATPAPVVVFMPEGSTTHKGGTMRLGARRTMLETVDCVTAKLYQARRQRQPCRTSHTSPDVLPLVGPTPLTSGGVTGGSLGCRACHQCCAVRAGRRRMR